MPSFSDRIQDSLKDKNPVADVAYSEPYHKPVAEYSAVNSGVTQEGGLSSITFKTLGYTQYAEQLELMRDALFPAKSEELSRINDKKFDAQKVLDALKQEPKEQPATTSSTPEIEHINAKLTEQLQTRQISEDFRDQVFGQLKVDPSIYKTSPTGQYTKVEIPPAVKVDDISQVENLDSSAYNKTSAATFVDTNTTTTSFPEGLEQAPELAEYGISEVPYANESGFDMSYLASVPQSATPDTEDVEMET